mgnify:CR=1 FL=1
MSGDRCKMISTAFAHMEPDILLALLADAVDPNVSPAMQVQRMWDRLKTMDLDSLKGEAHCCATVKALQDFESKDGRIVFVDKPDALLKGPGDDLQKTS